MFANLKMVSSLDGLYFTNKKKICEKKKLWDEGFGYKIDSENSDKIKIFLEENTIMSYKPSIYYSTKQFGKSTLVKSFIIFSTNKD
jgi:hypothetical protein